MINGKQVLGIIPARGGSKGLPGKALRELSGRSLLEWAVHSAAASCYLDRVIVSSEDAVILAAAQALSCDVPFRRPEKLARDDTPGVEPVLHALNNIPGYDYVVVLQVTSPLRNTQDIDGCIENIVKKQAPVCRSVTEVSKSPYWMFYVDEHMNTRPFIEGDAPGRRQDLQTLYCLNGAVYVADIDWLLQHRTFNHEQAIAYVMPQDRSLDIDTEMDLLYAQTVLDFKTQQPGSA